jgi:hypothetical protein
MKRSVFLIMMIFASSHLFAQCTKDVECKGNRICVDGKCVDPQENTNTPTAAPVESSKESLINSGAPWESTKNNADIKDSRSANNSVNNTSAFVTVNLMLSDVKKNQYKIKELSKQLTPEQKMMLVDSYKSKHSAVAPFILNLLISCGIGSFVQGDITSGLLILFGEGSGIILMCQSDATTEICGTVVYLLSYIGGLIDPWVYASGKNRELETLLVSSYYQNKNYNEYAFGNNPGNIKPSMRIDIPVVGFQF